MAMQAADEIVDKLQLFMLKIEGKQQPVLVKSELKTLALFTRRTEPYKQMTKLQDQELPLTIKYEQYLTGISSTRGNVCLQFIFNGGYRTKLSDG